MQEQRTLQGFNRKKLNDLIEEEEDEIGYGKIRIPPSSPISGLQHIRERHIGDIVDVFSTRCIPDKDKYPNLLEAYIGDLKLPKDEFKEYRKSLTHIKSEITKLENDFSIPYKKRGEFRRKFYSLELWEDLKKFPEEKFPQELIDYRKKVEELSLLLTKARTLLDSESIEWIDDSLEEVLSLVVEDPKEIWKEWDSDKGKYSHAYLSTFTIRGVQKFIFFTAENDGYLLTAYCKKPDFEDRKGKDCHRIYPGGGTN